MGPEGVRIDNTVTEKYLEKHPQLNVWFDEIKK